MTTAAARAATAAPEANPKGSAAPPAAAGSPPSQPPPVAPASSPPPQSPPPRPPRTPDPTPNPLRDLPPPELGKRRPGRPTKQEAAARAAATAQAATAATPPRPPDDQAGATTRPLPEDPEAREAARKSVRAEVAALLDMLSGVVTAIPPGKPLREWERGILAPPCEDMMFKYGANLPPEWALVIAAGAIGLNRWREYKAATSDRTPFTSSSPAAPPAVESHGG